MIPDKLRRVPLPAAALLALLVGAVGGTPAGAATSVAAAPPLLPNPAIQEAIGRFAHAQAKGEVTADIADLRRLSAPDFSNLVPQLAIFLVNAKGERETTAPGAIVSRLGITRGQVLRAIEPVLGVADPALHAQLESLLATADRAPGGVDFSEVRAFLSERGRTPSVALVRYLFKRSPTAAVTVLAQVEKSAPNAPDVVPAEISVIDTRRGELGTTGSLSPDAREDAIIALQTVAQSPDWWLRCYAAAIVRAEPRLAGASEASLRERLASDPDVRVRAVLEGGTEHQHALAR